MHKNNPQQFPQNYKSRAGAYTKSVDRRTWITRVSAIFLSLLFVIVSVAVSMSVAFPLFSAHADSGTAVNVWWPAENFPVTGTQPFKAMVPGMDVSQYEMFWQVDGGSWNWMDNNNTDYQHKEAKVDVSGWNWRGSGPYVVNFIVRQNGNVIGQHSIQLRLNTTQPAPTVSIAVPAPQQKSAPNPTPVVASIPTQTPATVAPPTQITLSVPVTQVATQPINSAGFYINPNSPAANQANAWRASRPTDAAMMDTLAAQPTAVWLGNWNGNVQSDTQKVANAAAAANKTAVFVAYNIPGRDCGGYSAGGTTADAYASWVRSVAAGIGSAKALVILEPDAIAGVSCLSAADQQTRLNLISSAVDILKGNANTKVYLDAGHSNWVDAATMSSNLKKAGITKADGFFLNVSNFKTTADETAYGTQVSQQLGGKHFVIDTSRNGAGPDGDNWCNPSGRSIGTKPTTSTGNLLVDAYLWLKTPGESDGNCNGAPSAGVWWPDYALGLVQRAK